MADPMTPADDALRAAVERVERALSRFEATRIADLDWPTKVSVDPADLRLLLPALLTAAEQVAGLREALAGAHKALTRYQWYDEDAHGLRKQVEGALGDYRLPELWDALGAAP